MGKHKPQTHKQKLAVRRSAYMDRLVAEVRESKGYCTRTLLSLAQKALRGYDAPRAGRPEPSMDDVLRLLRRCGCRFIEFSNGIELRDGAWNLSLIWTRERKLFNASDQNKVTYQCQVAYCDRPTDETHQHRCYRCEQMKVQKFWLHVKGKILGRREAALCDECLLEYWRDRYSVYKINTEYWSGLRMKNSYLRSDSCEVVKSLTLTYDADYLEFVSQNDDEESWLIPTREWLDIHKRQKAIQEIKKCQQQFKQLQKSLKSNDLPALQSLARELRPARISAT